MDKDSAAYAEHVLDLFTEITHRVVIVQPLKEIGEDITPSLAQALQFLLQHECCSMREVAQGLSMSYSAASQLTERLVKKGLVTRCDKEHDRRLSEIRLTETGSSIVERIKSRRLESMSPILKRMDNTSRKAMVEHLEEFIRAAIDSEKSALETCTRCGRDHISECVVNEALRAVTGTAIDKT
jgi:DNA-binding MarR family transcriptional regulator